MGANTLVKFSKQSKESKNLNDVDVLVAEFLESIKPAILAIIDLLSHRELNGHSVAADALSKFSEQGNISSFTDLNDVDVLHLAEFLESIRASIPQIISLLITWESDVDAYLLAKLLEQGKLSTFPFLN